MALRFPYRMAAAACLGVATAASAAPPKFFKSSTPPAAAKAGKADQQLADAIAKKLSATPALKGLKVDIACRSGAVELTGSVRDQDQRSQVVAAIMGIDGVAKINDQLVDRSVEVQPVQATAAAPPAGPPNPMASPPMAFGGTGGKGHSGVHGGPHGGVHGGAPGGGPVVGGPVGGPMGDGGMGGFGGGELPPGAMGGGGFGTDPTPIGQFGPGALYDGGSPKMPPYAWPTYAPYNNFSRVGYPQEYPWQAFPYIGPFYPFPKVPLGFRAIKLEWEDGHWYYGRTATKRDYWKIRYW